MAMKRWFGLGLIACAGAAMWVPVGGGLAAGPATGGRVAAMDLSAFSDARPAAPLRLLFIHHSCGGQLLAPPGAQAERGAGTCIYAAHPNGGDLRHLLEQTGYEVHEASYKSRLAEHTDLLDWPPKFRDQMDDLLRTSHQDETYGDARRNQVIVFKSCFPNSGFVGRGTAPGDWHGPALTVWNARASLTALLPEMAKHPEVLFVYVTAPPLAPEAERERAWKWLLQTVRGRPHPKDALLESGAWAREFNDWVKARDGWLANYAGRNVVVFDYYDVLTGHGRSNLSVYATDAGADAHASSDGNAIAAREFVPLLNRAVRRAGLSQ